MSVVHHIQDDLTETWIEDGWDLLIAYLAKVSAFGAYLANRGGPHD